jgi:TRAP-type C4-dicarboxylate transport system substrate-binding protein
VLSAFIPELALMSAPFLFDSANADGYKTRIAPHDMSRLLWNSVGANGTELSCAETPTAPQIGLAKAGETAEVSYVAFGFGKVAPHFMMTDHMPRTGGIVVSERTRKTLSPEHQQILRDSLAPTQSARDSIRQIGVALVGTYE